MVISITQVQKLLAAQRYSLRSWSIWHGYDYSTVDKTLRRSFKKQRLPRGEKGLEIISKLEKTLNQPILKQ